jgi:signal transduction histidine kinase
LVAAVAKSKPSKWNTVAVGELAGVVLRHLPWQWVLFDRDLGVVQQRVGSDSSSRISSGGVLEDFFSAVELDMTSVDWRRRLKSVIQTGESVRIEHVGSTRREKEPRIYNLACSAIKDDEGNAVNGLLIVQDTTDRAVLEKRLAFYERLAVVGKLAARIAHELNNPLDGILRFVNLAMRVKSEEDPARRYLEQARKGLLRMVRIIRELLEFSRSTITAFEHTSVNGMIEEAARSMESQALARGVVIEKHLLAELPNVRSGDLFQVFCNLIKNAIDAMPKGGRLEITTSCVDNEVRATFTDTGVGIAPDLMDKIFEPFFTTKDPTEGTGLGLAISKDIVEKYGGVIRVRSEPGKGSTFEVDIPVKGTV